MSGIGIWRIDRHQPVSLYRVDVALEAQLETWIEANPSLLQGDLTILGRQMHIAGGILDLLAIDSLGRWTVIEIKRGALRRETVTQALDYASAVAEMPFTALEQKVNDYLQRRQVDYRLDDLLAERQAEEDQNVLREVQIIIVGTGQMPGVERMVNFLSSRGNLPIGVVSYDVFEVMPGMPILVRELSDLDPLTPRQAQTTQQNGQMTLDSLQLDATRNGIGEAFRQCVQTGQDLGLYLRVWKTSLMFAPPQNKTRCLFTIWTKQAASGKAKVYVATSAFSDFYPVTQREVVRLLGREGWREMNTADATAFLDKLRRIFAGMGDGP